MDRIECSAVYIDHRVSSERWVSVDGSADTACVNTFLSSDEPETLRSDVKLLLGVSDRIYLCQSGASLASKLAECNDRAMRSCSPIFAFFDVDMNGDESGLARRKSSRGSWPEIAPPSPTSLHRQFTFSSQSEGTHDLKLLSGLSADIQVQESPNLIVPVAILRSPQGVPTSAPTDEQRGDVAIPGPHQISKCLDAGAVDVLAAPLDKARVQGLTVHAYRIRKSALKEQSRFLSRKKLRKHSWVGVHDEQPYAYLREAMVSKLMKGICNPEEFIEDFQERELDIRPERLDFIKEKIGSWSYNGHDFSDDELVQAAFEMLQHAFTLPNLEHWHLTPDELLEFLLACRTSYNSFVLYHNFRHAIDVLQSVFCFLLHIGALPPLGSVSQDHQSISPLATLLTPFDTLTLLISAIGHDVGHPGVNNFFLVKLNAPLAQLYNDNSVLEAFHCAAFSQILRRYWPAAFKDKQLRKLLISSILATDMGVHQKFMERLGSLQEKFHENGKSLDGWKPQDLDMYKTLLCGLLIKCADISNVARPWEVAEQWTKILQEEFANQGEMEKEVGMETALFGGPPELGNTFKLATGQIGFMSIFALPLFEGVADILPGMLFTVEHIRNNQSKWHLLADIERKKQALRGELNPDDVLSPRTQSPATSIKGLQGLRAPLATPGSDTPVKPVFPSTATNTRNQGNDYFGSMRSPSETASQSEDSLNENAISPVMSPDTPGPSMDITGIPFPTESATRRSSSAVPELARASIVEASPDTEDATTPVPSNAQVDNSATTEANGSSLRDPAVLAAVVYAQENQDHDDSVGSVEGAGERPGSSRNMPYRRHHANTGSSGRTSGPSSSQRNSCTRTHSLSNYSNNMTPISPATNATSFLTVDSGDEKGLSQESNQGDQDDFGKYSSARPSSSSYVESGGEKHPRFANTPTSHPTEDANKGHFHMNSPRRENGVGSSHSTSTSASMKHNGHDQHHWNETAGGEQQQQQPSQQPRKRRSRLRLAFWRRKTHNSHHHELSGES